MNKEQQLRDVEQHIEDMTGMLEEMHRQKATLSQFGQQAVNRCLINVRAAITHGGDPMEAAVVEVAAEILLRQAHAQAALLRASVH